MQKYIEISENTPVEDSREQILDNDKTIASHFSGTAFPTENLVVGMECYRTDEDIKYRLTSLNPVTWKQAGELNGAPTAPTPDDTNTKRIANVEYVKAAIAELIGSSPDALDTLYELAYALGNDPNFATTVTNALAGKAPLSHTHTKAQVGLGNVDNTKDADKTVKAATTATNVSGSGTVVTNNITSNTGYIESKGTSSNLPQILFHIPNVNWARLRIDTDGVINVQDGSNNNYKNIKAANFITNVGVENGNIVNIYYDNGDGYIRKCSLAHLISKINGQIPGGRIWIT